jgi:DNA gyrase subunit A
MKVKTFFVYQKMATANKPGSKTFLQYNRGGQGVIALKTSDRNGKMVSAVAVDENDGIMLISDKGTLIRTSGTSQIPTLGRNTQGVKVITPKDGEKLIEGVRIPPEEDDEETAEAQE